MKAAADKKNTEVKVSINNSNPFVIIIPVDKSGYQSLQSVKTKQSSAIELAHRSRFYHVQEPLC